MRRLLLVLGVDPPAYRALIRELLIRANHQIDQPVRKPEESADGREVIDERVHLEVRLEPSGVLHEAHLVEGIAPVLLRGLVGALAEEIGLIGLEHDLRIVDKAQSAAEKLTVVHFYLGELDAEPV